MKHVGVLLHVCRQRERAERAGGAGAIVERKLRDERVVLGVGDGGVFGVDLVGAGGDVDRFAAGGNRERDGEAKVLARVERDAVEVRHAEACERRGERVFSGLEIFEDERAAGVADAGANGGLIKRLEGESGAGNCGSGGIRGRAANGAEGGLGLRLKGENKSEGKNGKTYKEFHRETSLYSVQRGTR